MLLQNIDIQMYLKCTEPTAIKRKREIAAYFNKKNQKTIHLSQLAKYEGVTEAEVLQEITISLKKTK
jgi:hypothetical protein